MSNIHLYIYLLMLGKTSDKAGKPSNYSLKMVGFHILFNQLAIQLLEVVYKVVMILVILEDYFQHKLKHK